MSEATGPHQPNEHHARIATHAGRWNVACTFFVGPGQTAMKVQATDEVTMVGPFFATAKFEADMFGQPFQGVATFGYDNSRGRYVSTWIDSMNSSMYRFEGQYDEATQTLEMRGENPDPATGTMTSWRTVEKSTSPDERMFEMFYVAPGTDTEVQICSYAYTRVAD